MTTSSTLFYGIFTDVIPLVAATTTYFDFINIYDPLILELTNHRSTNNLLNIPLEIWQQIRKELRRLVSIEVKMNLTSSLTCECCREGVCSDTVRHINISHEHSVIVPAHSEDDRMHYRTCCWESVSDRFSGGTVKAFEAWFARIGFTMTKLEEFSSLYDLYLFDSTLLDNDALNYYCFAIGALQSVEHEGYNDPTNDSCLAHDFTSLSTSSLRNFDYDTVDRNFEKLKIEHCITADKFEATRAIDHSSLEGPDSNKGPCWRLWCRI